MLLFGRIQINSVLAITPVAKKNKTMLFRVANRKIMFVIPKSYPCQRYLADFEEQTSFILQYITYF